VNYAVKWKVNKNNKEFITTIITQTLISPWLSLQIYTGKNLKNRRIFALEHVYGKGDPQTMTL